MLEEEKKGLQHWKRWKSELMIAFGQRMIDKAKDPQERLLEKRLNDDKWL